MVRKDYKKISRRKSTVASHSRLWLGKDHLLVVKEIGYTDEYKRFYFSDIQSISALKTRSYLVFAILLGIPLVLFAGFLGMSHDPILENITLLIFTTLFFVLMLVHLLRGATCKCLIRTSVNNEVLSMINRNRAFLKLIKQVHPLIQAAQGNVSLESIIQKKKAEEAMKKQQEAPQQVPVEAEPKPPTDLP